jgi:peptidoglycan/LPS O-acetylase OafA/YrhL
VLALIIAQLTWTGSSVPGWDSPATVIPANLLLIQSWGLTPSLIPSAWSISTEMAAYLMFPLLLRATLFGNRRRAVVGLAGAILALLLAVIGGRLWAVPDNGALDLSDGTTALPLLRCIGSFTLGLLAFRIAQTASVIAIVERDWFAVAVFATLILALLLDAPDLSVYPFLPLIVLIAATDRGLIPRLLASPPIYWLGECSYAIYLLHGDVIHASRHLSNALLESGPPAVGRLDATVFIVCAVLGLSSAAHRWIERPARRWLRRALAIRPAALTLGAAARRT